MGYTPIALDHSVPQSIQAFVEKQVRPILHDVRVMLAHPTDQHPIAFNLSAALVLASVIGGLSRVFFSNLTRDDESFCAVACRYPLAEEPAAGIRAPGAFADELYKTYRCNLVHSLALTVDKIDGAWKVVELGSQRKVVRKNPPLSEEKIVEVEQPNGRPEWLEATLSVEEDGVTRLRPAALYWGVRRLVADLAADPELRGGADRFLRPWFESTNEQTLKVTSSTDTHIQATTVALGITSFSARIDKNPQN